MGEGTRHVPRVPGGPRYFDSGLGLGGGGDSVGGHPGDLPSPPNADVQGDDPPSDGHRFATERKKSRIRATSLRAFLAGGAVLIVYAVGAFAVINVEGLIRQVGGLLAVWLTVATMMGASGFVSYLIWLYWIDPRE